MSRGMEFGEIAGGWDIDSALADLGRRRDGLSAGMSVAAAQCRERERKARLAKASERVAKQRRQNALIANAVRDRDAGWGFPLLNGDFQFSADDRVGDLREIVSAAAKASGVSMKEIRGFRRAYSITRPRQVCYLLAKQFTGMSYPKIGMYIGGRDHTTIMDGVKKAIALLECDAEFQALYARTRKILGV